MQLRLTPLAGQVLQGLKQAAGIKCKKLQFVNLPSLLFRSETSDLLSAAAEVKAPPEQTVHVIDEKAEVNFTSAMFYC